VCDDERRKIEAWRWQEEVYIDHDSLSERMPRTSGREEGAPSPLVIALAHFPV
jgi:hypothetical protein